MSSPDHLHSGMEKPTELKESITEIDFTDKAHLLLACPKCNHFISGADINIEKTIAKCSQCNHVFGFAHDSASDTLRPEQIIPEGVEVLKLKSELDIRLNWLKTTSKGGRTFTTLFTAVWNLMLLPIVLVIILSGNWGILLFLSLHLVVGLGLLYYLAAIHFNKTSVSINHKRIKIQTLPLRHPFYKARELDTQKIKQLYVSKYTQSTSNGVPNYAFALYAVMEDGEKVSLVRGMNHETQQYMEKEIEGYLGIKDKKVEGESG